MGKKSEKIGKKLPYVLQMLPGSTRHTGSKSPLVLKVAIINKASLALKLQ